MSLTIDKNDSKYGIQIYNTKGYWPEGMINSKYDNLAWIYDNFYYEIKNLNYAHILKVELI